VIGIEDIVRIHEVRYAERRCSTRARGRGSCDISSRSRAVSVSAYSRRRCADYVPSGVLGATRVASVDSPPPTTRSPICTTRWGGSSAEPSTGDRHPGLRCAGTRDDGDQRPRDVWGRVRRVTARLASGHVPERERTRLRSITACRIAHNTADGIWIVVSGRFLQPTQRILQRDITHSGTEPYAKNSTESNRTAKLGRGCFEQEFRFTSDLWNMSSIVEL
jgi:hypothetical protein